MNSISSSSSAASPDSTFWSSVGTFGEFPRFDVVTFVELDQRQQEPNVDPKLSGPVNIIATRSYLAYCKQQRQSSNLVLHVSLFLSS